MKIVSFRFDEVNLMFRIKCKCGRISLNTTLYNRCICGRRGPAFINNRMTPLSIEHYTDTNRIELEKLATSMRTEEFYENL